MNETMKANLAPELLHACPECAGAGQKEKTVNLGNGIEADVECMCGACCGLGYLEAADMLRTLVAIRDAHHLARMNDQPGLGLALAERVAHVLATMPYSSLRYAEMKR
jgi:hypothetical protein